MMESYAVADMLKNAVRLTFPKGAQMKDPKKLFNTRLDSKTVRAIDFHEGDTVDEEALKALILEAVGLNTLKERETIRSTRPAYPLHQRQAKTLSKGLSGFVHRIKGN